MLRLVIPGAPRTKKTSNRIVRIGRGENAFNKILPSEAYENWFKQSMGLIVPPLRVWARQNNFDLPIRGQVWVKAIFYAENANVGDLTGYEQGLADFLQSPRMSKKTGKLTRDGAGVIDDDKQIASWDGSRVRIDRADPRIELEIRPFQEALLMPLGIQVDEVIVR